MMGTLFVDAETDGLFGTFLSVASIMLDDVGDEVDEFYGVLREPETAISLEWVRVNVFPYLKDPVRSDSDYYETEDDLIEAFWGFYMRHRGADVISDVPHPVESRLFARAVGHDLKAREFMSPYPLLDLSSMLYINGYDPIIARGELVDVSDLRIHNAFDDVRMTIRVWKKMKGLLNER